MKVELVCDHSCLLGEGPVWNGREKKICWVDILNGEIHEYDVVQKKRNTISVRQMVGAIAPEKNGHYVAALQHGLGFINRQTAEVEMIADP
ncbi:MAG: SMP-30/gluconolactonase/LRE family protein, partial [Puia sp.]